MRPRFLQFSCREGNKPDYRQANAVLKYKPDIILFEMPAEGGNPSLIFNRYKPDKKPFTKVEKIKKSLRRAAKKYPYAASDIRVWENIEKLWREGRETLLFNVDAPQELRAHYHKIYGDIPYTQVRHEWWFWAYLLIRECQMAGHIENILKHYRVKRKPTVAVFLQSIHWEHVKFLLRKPSEKGIWRYYFGKFPEISPANIRGPIKKKDKILYKYWK